MHAFHPHRLIPALIAACLAWPPALAMAANARYDFDGDGRSDLLWLNATTGKVVARHGGMATNAVVLGQAPGPGWQVAGSGQTNHSASAQLIWHEPATGNAQIWYGGNSRFAHAVQLIDDANEVHLGPEWRLSAIGHFSQFAWQQLLWRNRPTAALVMGTADFYDAGVFHREPLCPAPPSQAWTIVGTGGFDNTGIVGIFWRNATTRMPSGAALAAARTRPGRAGHSGLPHQRPVRADRRPSDAALSQ